MNKKIILMQVPDFLFEIVSIFYKEANKYRFFDKFYIVTNYKGDNNLGDNCEMIKLKEDLRFGSNMLYALDKIKEDIFLVCCEDAVFKDKNNVKRWEYYFNYFLSHPEIGFLRLSNTKHKVPSANGKYTDVFPMKTKYRYYISLQPAWWRKEYFRITLKHGITAFKYEARGSKLARRARRSGKTELSSYCVKDNVIERTNFCKDGKYYRRQFIDYALKNNIKINKDKKVLYKGEKISCDKYINKYLK